LGGTAKAHAATSVVTFTSPNPTGSGGFGSSVAVNRTSVVVGAPGEVAGGAAEGHAYVVGYAVVLVDTLTSRSRRGSGSCGSWVAMNGTSVVVGAPGETASGSFQAGNAYVFSSAGVLIATLTSPNPTGSGSFGSSVAVSGSSVGVGAPGEVAGGAAAGHAYVFGSAGALVATLTSPNPTGSGHFGSSVAMNGTSVVVGAPGESPGGSFQAGNAYVFSSAGVLVATLTSPNPTGSGRFGSSVAMSGSSVVVGAPGETASGSFQAGNAYVFSSAGVLIATLTSPNPTGSGSFGSSVAVSGSSVGVGAPGEVA